MDTMWSLMLVTNYNMCEMFLKRVWKGMLKNKKEL